MSPLSAAPFDIDHVIVAGRDLKAMQAALAAVGLVSEYGGPHTNHATEMSLTSFPDGSYLELLAMQPNADAKAVAAYVWAKQVESSAGPCAWVARAKDFDGEIKRLREAGVKVDDAVRNGRVRPDGTRLEWEAAKIGEDPTGTFFPSLDHDFTPRQNRASLKGKPTTRDFGGVAKVVIAVRDMDRRGPTLPPGLRRPAADQAGGCRFWRATGPAGQHPGDSGRAAERAIVAYRSAGAIRRGTVRFHTFGAPAQRL